MKNGRGNDGFQRNSGIRSNIQLDHWGIIRKIGHQTRDLEIFQRETQEFTGLLPICVNCAV